MFKISKEIILCCVLILFISFNTAGVLAENYQLHTGDRLIISVWGHEDLSSEIIIGPDGYINFPLISGVKAEGLTTEELKKAITEKISNYIKSPQVTVSLIEYHQAVVMILGEVQNPGSFQIEGSRRVLEVLSSAGGPTDTADMENVRLTRGNESQELDLNAVLKGKLVEQNQILEDGDVLFFPRRKYEVTISGEVNYPGSYEWHDNLRLAELAAKAGNITAYGNKKKVQIIHADESRQEVDLDLYYQKGSAEANPFLRPGDSVFVTRGNNKISILGEVQSPGSYDWEENLYLDNLLASAGSTTERGNLEKIKIIRSDGSSELINLNEYFEDSLEGENPLLLPGDTVQIKEKESLNWEKVFSFISGLNLIKNFLDIEW